MGVVTKDIRLNTCKRFLRGETSVKPPEALLSDAEAQAQFTAIVTRDDNLEVLWTKARDNALHELSPPSPTPYSEYLDSLAAAQDYLMT